MATEVTPEAFGFLSAFVCLESSSSSLQSPSTSSTRSSALKREAPMPGTTQEKKTLQSPELMRALVC